MEYDIAIIGGGAVGASLAYKLSHYKLRTVLLEKCSDVCFGVSKANSGIVHGGFHYSAKNTLKGRLELQGNKMFDRLQAELGFPFQRCGIMVVAFDERQMETIRSLYGRGVENGVPGIELCDGVRIRELEPKLASSACGGLFAPQGGVIEPYAFVFAMVTAARENGVDLMCDFNVASAKDRDGAWEITAREGRAVRAHHVVNAAGLYADQVSRIFGAEDFRIIPRKGEEYLLDKTSPARPMHVIFPVPTEHSKGVLVIPTVGGTTMIGPTATIVEDKEDKSTSAQDREKIFALAKGMVSGITEKDLITSFSGSRPVLEGHEDFHIAPSAIVPRLIQAAGIQSPGLTASPAIAEMLANLLGDAGLPLVEKENYILPEQVPSLRHLTPEQVDALYAKEPGWTNVVCRCEKVSEAEIRRAIRRGHTTVDGIKLATRAGMGRCQGGFCTLKIMRIIADECKIPLEEVLKREPNGQIAAGKIGSKIW